MKPSVFCCLSWERIEKRPEKGITGGQQNPTLYSLASGWESTKKNSFLPPQTLVIVWQHRGLAFCKVGCATDSQ
jgi:hypothetical protein